jgi:hypothetical protein
MRYIGYATVNNLRKNKVVQLGDKLYAAAKGELRVGDIYIGGRQNVNVYVCRAIDTTQHLVFAMGSSKSLDPYECIKVCEVKGCTPDYIVAREILARSYGN